MEQLVLVDRDGQEIGTAEKMAAHQGAGRLHLAFSILVFNQRGEVLLQRRADCKYHFAGLWSNTCCGHPRPGEGVLEAGERRLKEEFGLQLRLHRSGQLIYEANDASSGLMEHEYLHVLWGRYPENAGEPQPDPAEIGAWEWRELEELQRVLKLSPERYAPWLPLVLSDLSSLDPMQSQPR